MTLEEALSAAEAALGHWSEYLEENDREAECETYDSAATTIAELKRLIVRGPRS